MAKANEYEGDASRAPSSPRDGGPSAGRRWALALTRITAIVAVLAMTAVAAVAGYRYVTRGELLMPVRVRVTGVGRPHLVHIDRDGSVRDALAVAGISPRDGVERSVVQHRIIDAHHDPVRITVAGRTASLTTKLRAGSRIVVANGRDAVEATKKVNEVLPPPPMPTVMRHVEEVGSPGEADSVVGVRSGEVVSRKVVRPPVPPQQSTRHVVALTFDDGPSATGTEAILAVLRAKGVHATFCEIGTRVDEYPALSRRVVVEGHRLCNHTQDHDEHLIGATQGRLDAQIGGGAEAFARQGLPAPQYYRPPGGFLSRPIEAAASALGEQTLYWKVDTKDWQRTATSDSILATLFAQVDDGAIILMHDGGRADRSATIDALGKAIDLLRAKGYDFVFPTVEPAVPAGAQG